jgi:DNA-binding XRE family transcriptional regulator
MSLQDLPSIYKEELENRLTKVKTKIGEKGTEEELKGIGQVLSLLELEARALRNPQRRENLLASCSTMRKELNALTEENQRKALLSRPKPLEPDDSTANGGKRSRGPSIGDAGEEDPEANKKLLSKSRESLKRTQDTIAQTIDVATSTIDELHDQEQTLNRIHVKVSTTNMLAGKARVIIRSMEQGEVRSKMIMYGAVIFVVIALIVAMYFVLFGGSK